MLSSRFLSAASRSLRVRFLAALLLGAAMITAIGSYATYRVAQSHVRKQLLQRSELLASAINHSAMIARTNADLQHVVEEILHDNPDIRTIAITLRQGLRPIASASSDEATVSETETEHLRRELVHAIGSEEFGVHLENNQDLVLTAPLWHALSHSQHQAKAGGQTPANSRHTPSPDTHHAMGEADASVPDNHDHGGHSGYGSSAIIADADWITQELSASDYRGGILLRMDRSGVIATMSAILWGLMPVSIVGVFAILGLAYTLLHYQVIFPISGIRHVMKRQQSGDREARAERQSTLEFDDVAAAFNGMIDAILERENLIKRNEKELIRHRDHLQELVNAATQDLKTKAEELKEALAKEQELNDIQRNFVTMASHEFRTPLSIIDTAAQRLKRRADNEKPDDTAKRADKIRAAVQRMTRLMDSVLSAARMEEGKIEIKLEPCDIGKVLRDVCEGQQEIAQSHTISCDLADLPGTIKADSWALEQIFTNLLSNAVKYAPDAPEIHVRADQDGDRVIVSVRDHGIGIDEDDLERIGERFFRARTSTGIAGTGIGLNLVRVLVDMHGGSIDVESRKGEGSVFKISLPISGPDDTQQADAMVA